MPMYKFSSGLPQLPSSGLQPEQFQLVQPLYLALTAVAQRTAEATGNITYDQEELSARNQLGGLLTQNHRRIYPLAVGTLAFGKLVSLTISGGKLAAQLADAASGLKAHGVVEEPYGITSGQYGSVLLLEGLTTGISGTVLGEFYYLHNSGNIALAPPAGAPLTQRVGLGMGSAGFYLSIQAPN